MVTVNPIILASLLTPVIVRVAFGIVVLMQSSKMVAKFKK